MVSDEHTVAITYGLEAVGTTLLASTDGSSGSSSTSAAI